MYFCPTCARAYAKPGFCTDDGTELDANAASARGAATSESLVGRTLGSYRIERSIGRGGMGEVFLGVQPEIGSRVAIKLLGLGARPEPAMVDRFFAEARAVNLIRHEGIVNVIDLAHLPDGRPYMVMEYLEGAPLSAALAAGPMPLVELGRIMAEVLDALGAAHAAGITHRDLKPDNIFVTSGGRTKLLDFGIAKLKPELDHRTPDTHTGALLGTPHYMSPEQARGRRVDHRSDLYSIGVILFECATGRRPFEAESLYELLHQHVSRPPASVRALRPDLPPAFETVVARALEKEPDRRFQSAAELARALSEAVRASPHPSLAATLASGATAPSFHSALGPSTMTGAGRTVSPPARRPGLLIPGLLVATVVATLAVGVVSAWAYRPGAAGGAHPATTRYDARHFDALGFLPAARATAREQYADAELVSLIVHNVGADGRADLAGMNVAEYTFRSPAASPKVKDPTASLFGDCNVTVTVRSNAVVASRSAGDCVAPLVTAPRCSMQQVAEKAGLRAGTRATMELTVIGIHDGWRIAPENMPVELDDDC